MAQAKQTRAAAKVQPWIVLLVLGCLVASALTYFLFTAPKTKNAAALRSQLVTAKNQDRALQSRISDVRSGKKTNAQQLLGQARTLDKQLPSSVDSAALAGVIPQLAAAQGVKVTAIDLASASTKPSAGQTKSQGFNVTASGPVPAVMAWIGQLQSYSPVLTVSNLAITTGATVPGASSAGSQSSSSGSSSTANQPGATFLLTAYYVTAAPLSN